MVRSAVADEALFSYLSDVAKQNIFSIGLILGQSCAGKDYIIHFAKTPPIQTEDGKNEEWQSIADVNENWVSDHARQGTRMLPGGIYVLGIFVTSPDDLLNPFNVKIKTILQKIHKQLDSNKYLYGNNNKEKIILSYSTKTQKYFCKAYDIGTTNVQLTDLKFLPKLTKWCIVESYLEIDELRYLRKQETDWPLQNHMKVILNDINDNLESAVYLFDNEFRDKDDSIELLGKKKVKTPRGGNKVGQDTSNSSKPINVSILQSKCVNSFDESDLNKITETCGHLKIVGRVASKVWLQPKMTIWEASASIKQDIMRSLAARFEMHLDSLTEEENSEDVNSVHEPPRRVLVTLPSTEILLSDYLFPGEGAQDAKVSLEELLDIKITGKLKIHDVEGQADINEYYNSALESNSNESLQPMKRIDNNLWLIGLMIGILVVIIAVVLTFYL